MYVSVITSLNHAKVALHVSKRKLNVAVPAACGLVRRLGNHEAVRLVALASLALSVLVAVKPAK